jgi:hypothetical protein
MPRTISIDRQRLARWLENFAVRHGEPTATSTADTVIFTAPDGAEAKITVPFPPGGATSPQSGLAASDLVDHVLTDRRVGALLVRRGGYAIGIFAGQKLINSKIGGGYVQGKTKAGGWSQQRYARRRDNQARQLYDRAAEQAELILLPEIGDLAAVVTGGDRSGIAAVLEAPNLKPIKDLALPRVHPTDDPRLKVLQAFPDQFLALEIELNDLA